MTKCKVESFVYYEHKKGDYVLPHQHKYYELVYYIDGEGETYVCSEKVNFTPGTICIVKPNEKHDEVSKIDSRVYIVLLSFPGAAQTFPNLSLKLSPQSARVVTRLLETVRREYQDKRPYFNDVADVCMQRVLVEMLREKHERLQKVKRPSPGSDVIKNTKKFLKENFSQDIDYKQLADSCGYSYDRFRHIFAGEVGKTMNQYLLDIRFAKAKEFLENTELNIKEICFNCGFNSLPHFVNFFKQKMNISPGKYRRYLKEKNVLGVAKLEEKTVPLILLDTDLGGDCDDVGAVALLNELANRGEAEIAGIAHNTSLRYGVACIDIINRFYGRKLTLGAYRGAPFLDGQEFNRYAQTVAERFGSPYLDPNLAEDSVSYLRRRIACSKRPVRLVGIGQLNNLDALLCSPPDEISPLSGRELLVQGVCEVVVMGGMFKTEPDKVYFAEKEYDCEYNIKADIKSAQHFIADCPVKITFIDFLIGYKVKTLGRWAEKNDAGNPVAAAYNLFCGGARESWDLIAVLYAVRGEGGLFVRSPWGEVTVSGEGHTSFAPCDGGRHSYLRSNVPDGQLADCIDEIIMGGEQV